MNLTSQLPLLPLVLSSVPAGLRRCLAQEGIPHVDHWSGQAWGQFVLFDSRLQPAPRLVAGQTTIDVAALASGEQSDPFADILDEQSARFAWPLDRLMPSEVVSRVDKREVRRKLMANLQGFIERAGGVWAKLAPCPAPYRSAFNFRIDHDEFDKADMDATLTACAGHERAISHYVCASTHEAHPASLAALRGQHVGSHGYWHHTYRDAGENLANIRRGIESLAACGIEPDGFAAPHGRFNRGLLTALGELRVTHSSEFGLAYDDLPFFPGDQDVLQIPIHPICLGVCLEAARRIGVTEQLGMEATQRHFEQVIRGKHAAGEQIFLYGHPTGRLGRYPGVLRAVLETVSELPGIWKTTLAEFARWWRLRARVRVRVTAAGSSLRVTAENVPRDFPLGIELWHGERVATLPLVGRELQVQMASHPMERRAEWRTRVRPIHQPDDWRASLRRYLDWEHVTPTEEIVAATWRGWAKRSLRRIKHAPVSQ